MSSGDVIKLINMNKKEDTSAVRVEDLFFYYLTPEKKPLFEGSSLPFKKIVFEKNVALNHVSLNIQSGGITALLGRNGSGKTSLIKIITGARLPHGGKISVFNESPDKIKHRLGLCLGGTLVYHRLTARENLEYFAKLYGVEDMDKRILSLSEMLDLTSHLDQMVETFSFGMKMKLALARSMIHSPDLLILDEPTLGIDIEHANHIREFIRNLKCTVLLTTHYMEEAEMLSDYLCFIDKGNILAHGTKSDVLSLYGAQSVPDAFTHALKSTTEYRKAS
jgi:ABC-type multidrug transport system ATPase subunit